MIFPRRPPTATASVSTSAVAPRRLEHDLGNSEPLPFSDPFLDFGMSVDICNEERRAAEMEIKQLAAANIKTREEVATEEKVAEQLDKDLTHAHKEMKSTKTQAAELLGSNGLKDQLVQRLATTLQTEIMAPVLSSSHSTHEFNLDDHAKENAASNSGPTNVVFSFQAAFDKQREDVKKRAESIKGHKEALALVHSQICASEQNYNQMRQRTDEMEEALAKDQKAALESQALLEAEQQRNAKLKESLEQTRRSTAQWTEQADKLSKELARQKSANRAREKELEENEKKAAKKLEDAKKSYELHEAENARLDREIEELTRQVVECERRRKIKEDLKSKREQVFRETLDFQKKEAEALAQLDATTALLDEAAARLRKLKDEEDAVNEKKQENDTLYAEKVLPAQSELAELSKEEVNLVSLVDEMQERIDAHKKTVDEALANIKESQDATEENLKTVQAEIESMRGLRGDVQREHEITNNAILTELDEVETLTKETTDANEAEQKRIDELQAQRAERRETRLRETNEAIDLEHKELMQVRDVLVFGKDLLKKTVKEKARLLPSRSQSTTA